MLYRTVKNFGSFGERHNQGIPGFVRDSLSDHTEKGYCGSKISLTAVFIDHLDMIAHTQHVDEAKHKFAKPEKLGSSQGAIVQECLHFPIQ